jgi:hypothetical protein
MATVSRALSKLGNDVVARMAQEVVRGASVVQLQFLASDFYEALKAELDQTPRHEAARVGALAAAAHQCLRSAENCTSAHQAKLRSEPNNGSWLYPALSLNMLTAALISISISCELKRRCVGAARRQGVAQGVPPGAGSRSLVWRAAAAQAVLKAWIS